MKKPTILFRNDLDTEDEFLECSNIFSMIESRSYLPKNKLVIGRYSCVPYYQDLEKELLLLNSKLINSYEQHLYIASMAYIKDI